MDKQKNRGKFIEQIELLQWIYKKKLKFGLNTKIHRVRFD